MTTGRVLKSACDVSLQCGSVVIKSA
jgi:hypothetical protein